VIDTSYLTGIAFSPGDLKFIDLNDDKRINKGANTLGDMGDMTIIGNAYTSISVFFKRIN